IMTDAVLTIPSGPPASALRQGPRGPPRGPYGRIPWPPAQEGRLDQLGWSGGTGVPGWVENGPGRPCPRVARPGLRRAGAATRRSADLPVTGATGSRVGALGAYRSGGSPAGPQRGAGSRGGAKGLRDVGQEGLDEHDTGVGVRGL